MGRVWKMHISSVNGKTSEVTGTNYLRKKTCEARLGRRQRSSGKAWSKGWGNEVVPSRKPRVRENS